MSASNHTSPCTVPCIMAVALKKVEIRERKLEQLEAGAIRVKTEYSMVSTGTELHHIEGTHTKGSTFPRMTGYAAVGKVVGVGEGVEGKKLGDRVLIPFAHYAMIDAPADRCMPIPEGVDPKAAACIPLLGISIRGVRAGRVTLGDAVAVFGQGVIGAFATHFAKLAGAATVIAIDPVAKRREVARELGADEAIDPFNEDVPAKINEMTDGEGVNVAIESTATARVASSLPDIVASEGRIVILGGVHGKVEMDLYTRFQKSNQTMIGAGSAYHADYPYDNDIGNRKAIIRMLKSGMIKPMPAISHCVPHEQAPEMYRMLMEEKEKAIGVHFDWTKVDV